MKYLNHSNISVVRVRVEHIAIIQLAPIKGRWLKMIRTEPERGSEWETGSQQKQDKVAASKELTRHASVIVTISKSSPKNKTILKSSPTLPPKKRNSVHSIALYWPDFQCLYSHSNSVIFNKTFTNTLVHDFMLLLTTFESKLTYCVMSIDRLKVRRNRQFDHFLGKRAYFLYFRFLLK